MMEKRTDVERAATQILKNEKINTLDAARLIMELLEENSKGNTKEEIVKHCRRVIHMGVDALEKSEHTVSFREAADALVLSKNKVRERTLAEIGQICKRIMRNVPELGATALRQIDTVACQTAIEKTFQTVPMQLKGKRIMHALFAHAKRNGWCNENPVEMVQLAPHKEKPIGALPIDDVRRLLEVAKRPEHILCAPALGMMLWAGIRPYEMSRLHVSDLRFDDHVITIQPEHSKTGGARHVTMYPVLYYWLRQTLTYRYPSAKIVPGSWGRRWVELRQDAGFEEWVPDILRHTFASYHLKFFKNLPLLQMEMGHSSLALLYTRYLSMEGVTEENADIFWTYDLPKRALKRLMADRK